MRKVFTLPEAMGIAGFYLLAQIILGSSLRSARDAAVSIDEAIIVNFVVSLMTLALMAFMAKGRSRLWQMIGLVAPKVSRLRVIKAMSGAIVGYVAWSALVGFIFTQFDVGTGEQDIANVIEDRGLSALIPIAGALIVAPFFEEVLFRGVLFKGLRSKMPFILAALVSGLLFGIVHGSPLAMAQTFGIGVALAFVAEDTGSLWPAIALHFINNAIAVGTLLLL